MEPLYSFVSLRKDPDPGQYFIIIFYVFFLQLADAIEADG